MQESLLPSLIPHDSPSYSAVVALREILEYSFTTEGERIRNVALTGPYGSGKSSILYTLQKECEPAAVDSSLKNLKFLPISLALLKGGNKEDDNSKEDTSEEDNAPIDSKNQPKDSKQDEETINRRIEYSILQQLIYREQHSVVPDSRIKRIHSSKSKLSNSFLFKVLLLIACICILFEPDWLKVETISDLFNFGKYNVIGDIAALGYIIWFSWKYFLPKVTNIYHRYRLEKIDIKGAEIKMDSENSIFNQHLDEILYFFSQTEYNVILIEDVDRFDTSSIFLKLRELSILINESKIVGRHVTFVYAIKDNMFKDEDRVKFFDQIVTVIPFINSSNSKDILKKKLEANGVPDELIPNEAISEMAFFIHDMRMLINIVNEFCQYRKMLSVEDGQRLSMTKLLAMIVYKNFFPKDFNLLHRRKGKIYQALQQRDNIEEWLKDRYKIEENELKELETVLAQNRNKSVEEIRLSFLTYLVIGLEIPKAVTINLGNKYYSFSEIAASDILFDKLLNLDSLYYGICNSQDNYEKSSMWRFDNSKITSRVKSFKLNEKLSSLKRDYQDKIRHKREVLHSKYSQIMRRPLAFYLTKFPEIANLPYFAEIELPDMLLLFLQEGYIDEDYYDYISYFYEGMLSETDNDWILNMKLHRIQDYQYHFNHLENLIKSLKLSHFDHLAILNIDILDYLYEHRVGSLNPKFTAMMKQIKSSDLPQDFLYCYSQFGKHKNEILGEYFTWDEETTWILADEYSHPSQSESLKALWCKYTKVMPDCTQEWLECNFSFLIHNLPIIGEMRVKELISECTFERLSQAPPVLIKTAVLNNSFIISYENIKMALSTLHETSEGHPSFSSILSSGSKELIQYLTDKENISLTLEALVSHEVYEDESGSLFVVNNSDLTEDQKISYLSKQTVKISDISSIEDEYLKLAVANDFILPSWQNASSYYESKGLDEDLRQFIVRGYEAISKSTSEDCIISSSQYWNLCVELFISDKLPSNIHRTLLDSLKFEVPPINSLSTLDSIRFKNLVDSNNIKCEEAFMNCLDNTANLGILIESAPQNYLRYTENKEMQINLHSAIYIFNSSVLSKKEKENIFWTISPAIISEDVSLIIFASEILTNSNELGHWDGSEILSLVSSEVPVDRKRKLWLKAISKDGKLVPKVLSQMGEDYVEIMNPDKRPTFPNDNFHKSFLTALVNLEYIKSYHPDKKGLRVFH